MMEIISGSGNKHFRKDEVRVWYTFINKWNDRLGEFKYGFHTKEAARLKLIKNESLRSRFIVTRYLLRELISSYLNLSQSDLKFETNETGKPYLAAGLSDKGINFNISHAGNLLMIGICETVEIGIDVEKIKERENLSDVAKRFFTSRENELINSFSGEEKLKVFYRLWTLKEAYAKARGISMVSVLDGTEVCKIQPPLLKNSNFKIGSYTAGLFDFEKEYSGAIVTRSSEKKVSFIEV
jgi:4'-phosphopantetheinyl transferase